MKSRKRSVGKRGRAGLTIAIVVAVATSVISMATAAPAATNLPTAPRSPAAGPHERRRAPALDRAAHSGGSRDHRATSSRRSAAAWPAGSRVFRSRATTQVFPGLKNGKTYTFRVAARSAAGTGPRSVLTSAIVVGTPMAPTAVKVAARLGDRRCSPGRRPPRTTARSSGATSSPRSRGIAVIKRQTLSRAATLAIVNGLKNGVGYRFTLRARNARGSGPPSKRSNTIIPKPLNAAPPPAAGYFTQLPPGAALPSSAACAARVHQSSWEPRADNDTANHTVPKQPVKLASTFPYDATWQTNDRPAHHRQLHAEPPTRSSSGRRASGDGPTTSCARRP